MYLMQSVYYWCEKKAPHYDKNAPRAKSIQPISYRANYSGSIEKSSLEGTIKQ